MPDIVHSPAVGESSGRVACVNRRAEGRRPDHHGRLRGVGCLCHAHRLFAQIGRVLEINELRTVTREVVETARGTLVMRVSSATDM
jgi:hypothetical protein